METKKTITAKEFLDYIYKRKKTLDERIASGDENQTFMAAGELIGLTNAFNVLFNGLENPLG